MNGQSQNMLTKERQIGSFESPQNNFFSIHYKTPILQFCPSRAKRLRRFERKYEIRLRKISREAKKEFNSLFPRSKSKRIYHQMAEYSDGGHIYNTNEMLEHGLINLSKITQTINLLEGRIDNNENYENPSYQIYNGERNKFKIEKAMSNINEGVELSTGRQNEEGLLKLNIKIYLFKLNL